MGRIFAGLMVVCLVAAFAVIAVLGATLSQRPTQESTDGTVVNVSSTAIVIDTDEGERVTGPFATGDSVLRSDMRPGVKVEAVQFRTDEFCCVIYVMNVQR